MYDPFNLSASAQKLLAVSLCTELPAVPSVAWVLSVGWLEDLMATLGERGEVAWPSSHSEEMPGSRSFFAPPATSDQVCISGFDTGPRELCVNDLSREFSGSF